MIKSRKCKNVVLSLWLTVATGCTPEAAKRLEFGEPVASVMFEVELPKDGPTPDAVFERFQIFADNQGHDVHVKDRKTAIVESPAVWPQFLEQGEPFSRQSSTWRNTRGVIERGFDELLLFAIIQNGQVRQIKVRANFPADKRFTGRPMIEEDWAYAQDLFGALLDLGVDADRVRVLRHPSEFTEPVLSQHLSGQYRIGE